MQRAVISTSASASHLDHHRCKVYGARQIQATGSSNCTERKSATGTCSNCSEHESAPVSSSAKCKKEKGEDPRILTVLTTSLPRA
eukprot:g68678.t1